MNLILLTRKSASSKTRPLLLSSAAAALAVLAGASGLVSSSPYAPLLLMGGILAIAIFIVWLARPRWALYAALVLVFLPFGLIPSNIQSLLNRSVSVIAGVVWLARLLVVRKKMIWAGPGLLMLCFVGWSSLTLLWAEKLSPATIALQVYSMRLLVFLFLIPNEISTRQDLDALMRTLAFSGWILMASVVKTLLLEGYTPGSRLRIFAENENGAGLVALVTMVGVVWQASQPSRTHRPLRILTTAIFVLLTFGLVAMSGSRGSALSLIITLSLFWLWKPLRHWGKLGVLSTVLALIFIPSIFTTLVHRFAVERHDTLLGGREVLWQAAWHMIEDHPLLGVGIGNAPYASMKYLGIDAGIIGAENAPIHNPILTIWSEAALPGMMLYLSMLASSLILFGKQYLRFTRLRCDDLTPYFAVVSSVTVGYMVSWFKGGGMESAHSYFLILALLMLPSVLDATSFGVALPAPQLSRVGG